MQFKTAICFFLLSGLFTMDSVLAENWPRFRGPTGQGVSSETGLPLRWSQAENIAWRTAIPGQGWSSPIVFDDRVFLTTATENGVSCRVLCLDRRSGQILWNREVFQQTLKRKEAKNSYATPTPVTDGQRVYAVFCDGSIVALDYDGKVIWENRQVKFYSQHGLGASPILFEDLLIMPYDGSSEGPDRLVGWQKPWDQALILALDKHSGQVRWQARRGASRIAHVTPCVLRVGQQMQLISAAGDVVQGHDLRTGQLVWSARGPGEGVVPSIVTGLGLVFHATGFGQPTIRAVRPDGTGDVSRTHVVWEQTEQVPMMSSFVFSDGMLFTIKENGIAMCLDASNGKILWKERIGGNYCASPVLAEGRICFLSEEGQTTIIEAAPTFRVIARNSIAQHCQASMAISQGQIFIRSATELWCIGHAVPARQP